LSCSKDWFQSRGEILLDTTTCLPLTPLEIIVLSELEKEKITNYQKQLYENKPGPPQSIVRFYQQIEQSLQQHAPPPKEKTITNRTIFWHIGIPIAQYCKQAYEQE
jgi:hypothetical protein